MGSLQKVQEKFTTVRAQIENPDFVRQLERALPRHVSVDRLLRVTLTSLRQNPALLDCTPRSLLAAVMTAAQLGLEPDNFLGLAYLVPFKRRGVLQAQLIPGYRGLIALARRSGEVQSVTAQVVFKRDRFLLEYGLDERLEHRPADGDRGEPVGAYAIFRFKDGGHVFDYMTLEDIEKIRARSQARDSGPWVTDWTEMAKKTVIRRLAKLVPLSPEFSKAAVIEDLVDSGREELLFGDVVNVTPAAEVLPDFESTIPEGTDEALLREFLALSAETYQMSTDEVREMAARDPESFWSAFGEWAGQRRPPKARAARAPIYPDGIMEEEREIIDRLRRVKDTGMKTYFRQHAHEIETLSLPCLRWLRDKCDRVGLDSHAARLDTLMGDMERGAGGDSRGTEMSEGPTPTQDTPEAEKAKDDQNSPPLSVDDREAIAMLWALTEKAIEPGEELSPAERDNLMNDAKMRRITCPIDGEERGGHRCVYRCDVLPECKMWVETSA